MKNKKVGVLVIVLIIMAVAIGGSAVIGASQLSLFGEHFGDAFNSDTNEIVATCGDYQVTQEEINYHKRMNSEGLKNFQYSRDIDIANKIITGYLLLEIAEQDGLAATDTEINDMVTMTKEAYDLPEGKAMIDEYCNGAGITVDEYFDIIKEQAYATITRQKLRNKFDEEYCKAHEIQYGNFSEDTYAEITKAYDEYRDSILAAHKDEITYNLK